MKSIYNKIAAQTSKLTTRSYSTSFSIGIYFLSKKIHNPIYAVYGFVRLADEIVDTFHQKDQHELLDRFYDQTQQAIEESFSLNPVLHNFQDTVHTYNIDWELIDTFLESMYMDLHHKKYDRTTYQQYIVGSAEVVGLMCLKIFTEGDKAQYEALKSPARRLGAAFQKVNFLRDLQSDYQYLGRSYFPGTDLSSFNNTQKKQIEEEIEADFKAAYNGIIKLPRSARLGVYIAYVYYYALFRKIQRQSPERIMQERIRIPNGVKMGLMMKSLFRYKFDKQ